MHSDLQVVIPDAGRIGRLVACSILHAYVRRSVVATNRVQSVTVLVNNFERYLMAWRFHAVR
jgi:hypothetical protein